MLINCWHGLSPYHTYTWANSGKVKSNLNQLEDKMLVNELPWSVMVLTYAYKVFGQIVI